MKKLLIAICVVCFTFAAGVSAEEFSGDSVSVMGGMTVSSKLYYKDFKTFRTEAMGMVIITNGDKNYQIFDDTKKYVVMDVEEYKEQNPMADVDDFEEFVEKNDMKKVGTEKVNGYKCDVYEGSVAYIPEQPAMGMKIWYSPKLDYPVKTESQMPAPMSGTAVSTLENIEIGKQPRSLFEIPAGYTQAQSMQDAMGMGGFSMPSGGEGVGAGEMPSQEQMDQMMKMMQEMMGGAQE
jgi:outer membrane lipoprotein-sorting protein